MLAHGPVPIADHLLRQSHSMHNAANLQSAGCELWKKCHCRAQVLAAIIDQELFGPDPPTEGRAVARVEELTREFSPFTIAPATHVPIGCPI